jgi:hypothetical protein
MLSQFSKYYLKLGSFPFTTTPLTNTHYIVGTNSKGNKWVYFGEMEDGSTTIREGRGIIIFDSMEVHVGYHEKNEMNGQARVVYKNGEWYQGDFKDHKWNGRGTYYSTNGDKWEGEWKNGKKHGDGINYMENGLIYCEKYSDGKMIEWNLIE